MAETHKIDRIYFSYVFRCLGFKENPDDRKRIIPGSIETTVSIEFFGSGKRKTRCQFAKEDGIYTYCLFNTEKITFPNYAPKCPFSS